MVLFLVEVFCNIRSMDKITRYYVAILRGTGCASDPGYYYMVFYITFFTLVCVLIVISLNFRHFKKFLRKDNILLAVSTNYRKKRRLNSRTYNEMEQQAPCLKVLSSIKITDNKNENKNLRNRRTK